MVKNYLKITNLKGGMSQLNCFQIIYYNILLNSMNLSITGKKMNTPVPVKKTV